MNRFWHCIAAALLFSICASDMVYADEDKGPPFEYRPLPADYPVRWEPEIVFDPPLPPFPQLHRISIPSPPPLPGFDPRQDSYILIGSDQAPIVSLAVATNGEFAGTGTDTPDPLPDALNWSSDIVTKEQWNAGFPMPYFGPWQMPNTATLDFDNYFGPAATQVALFWAGEENSAPLGVGENYRSFFAGRSAGHDPGPIPQWLAFGANGTVLASGLAGQSILVPEPSSAILLAFAFSTVAVIARRARLRR